MCSRGLNVSDMKEDMVIVYIESFLTFQTQNMETVYTRITYGKGLIGFFFSSYTRLNAKYVRTKSPI